MQVLPPPTLSGDQAWMGEVPRLQFPYFRPRDLLAASVPFPIPTKEREFLPLSLPPHPSPSPKVPLWSVSPRSHKAAVHASTSLPQRTLLVPLSLSPQSLTAREYKMEVALSGPTLGKSCVFCDFLSFRDPCLPRWLSLTPC